MNDTDARKRWTANLADRARRMWADGSSASDIAKALGNGITRSAVCGVAHRQNWGGARG